MDTVPSRVTCSWPYRVGEEVVAVVRTGFPDRLVSELRLSGCLGGELRAGVIAGTALPSASQPQASTIEKASLSWPCDRVTVERPAMPAHPQALPCRVVS